MCRPRLSCEIKGESRSSKARSLASRKFVSKTGWLAGLLLLLLLLPLVRACVRVRLLRVRRRRTGRSSLLLLLLLLLLRPPDGKVLSAVRGKMRANKNQIRQAEKRPRFSVRSHVYMSAYIL